MAKVIKGTQLQEIARELEKISRGFVNIDFNSLRGFVKFKYRIIDIDMETEYFPGDTLSNFMDRVSKELEEKQAINIKYYELKLQYLKNTFQQIKNDIAKHAENQEVQPDKPGIKK